MAYFISKNKRFIKEIAKAIDRHFGDHADVTWEDETIRISIIDGFEPVIDCLTPQEIEDGVMGGGYVAGLNGENFVLILDKTDRLDI